VKTLGIETSCDETSIAVVDENAAVLCNVIASSSASFRQSGGVVPEDAARKQVEYILPVLHEALLGANLQPQDIDRIAVTKGPGLLGSLLVGTTMARTIGALWNVPVIGIHHTFGHLSSTWLHESGGAPDIRFPVLTLSASGGHTDLWLRTSHTHGALLGRTRDDAAGEAFDKGASMLGLPYPGGPSIAKAALAGNADAFSFPRPLKEEKGYDFSFSGLKTSLKYTLRDLGPVPTPRQHADLAASYERAICAHLADRVARALENEKVSEVHLVGGVSANTVLRSTITDVASGVVVRWPQHIRYCTDNAAMIACACTFVLQEEPALAKTPWQTNATAPLGEFLHA
jgi:N6-L-threonylcarbamoyladenine synthase